VADVTISGQIRIGAKLPNSGPLSERLPLRLMARRAEEAGFDSVWVSDHVVMVRETSSRYPFSADGTMTWDPGQPWYDALMAMATAAAVTDRLEVGVAVLILPLRNPVMLAKQLASLDALSGGRLVVGAGAGWLAEEFEALEARFEARGEILDEWIAILRDCWTGTPRPAAYRHYRMPDGVLCYPTPSHPVQILVGGISGHALRRVARRGDGWLALQHADEIDTEALRAGLEAIRREAERAGRPAPERAAIRIPGPTDSVARRLAELGAVGITDLIVDVDWLTEDGPARTLSALRTAS
jgi:probable F420-dependent oxidoreductase